MSAPGEIPAEILAAIPHRPPMLLVDQIVARGENRIHCRRTFRPDEFFVQGHYPGLPIVPGVILIEAGMQTGAIYLSQLVAGKEGVPVAARINDVKFKRLVRPGDTVDIEAELTDRLADAFFLTVKLQVDGKLAARFDCSVTLAALPAAEPSRAEN